MNVDSHLGAIEVERKKIILENGTWCWTVDDDDDIIFYKMGHYRPLFLLFSSFQYRWQYVNTFSLEKFADDCIRTADLWCRKRPLCQLIHNQCPRCNLVKCAFSGLFYFFIFVFFLKQLPGSIGLIKVADDWIWNTDLWCRKRPLCQLSQTTMSFV